MKEKVNDISTRDLTLKQLNVLAAIARTGKITAAADVLGVTPPAVTAQLKLLEVQTGTALFDRTPAGMRMTDAGRYVLGIQSRMQSLLDECRDGLMEMRGLSRGRIVIGAASNAKYFAPRILAAFAKTHAAVDIDLTIANRQTIAAALEELRIDIAIMGRPVDMATFNGEILGPHPHVFIAAPGHPLVRRSRLALEDLASETLLLRERGSGTRLLLERILLNAQVEMRASMQIGDNEAVKQAAIANLGIAFVSAHTISAEVAAKQLAILPLQGFPIIRQWYAVHAKSKALMPAGIAMWNFLTTEGSAYLPDAAKSARLATSAT